MSELTAQECDLILRALEAFRAIHANLVIEKKLSPTDSTCSDCVALIRKLREEPR